MKRFGSLTLLFAVIVFGGVPAGADDESAPDKVIRDALAAAPDIKDQSRTLVNLAWPADGPTDPELHALARKSLVEFGAHALGAMRHAIRTVDPVYSADVVAAMIQARLRVTAGIPAEYHGALEDVLWYGSVDAIRLASHELAKQRFGPALMALVDSIYDHPELTGVVVRDLGLWRDYHARFELRRVLDRGTARERRLAAEALAKIGGQAVEELRSATLSNDSLTRRSAIGAFLPESNINDLTALYEYIAEYGEENPQLTEQILERATYLESVLEARRDAEAASPELDD